MNEFESACARLNTEYTKKMNGINRRKDEVACEKRRRLLAIQMETAAKRDEIRTRIEMLRKARMEFEKDSQAYVEKTEAIRIQDTRIARLKEQMEIEASKIKCDAYATRMQLDEDARRLSEWLALEKDRLREYPMNNPDDNPDNTASITHNL